MKEPQKEKFESDDESLFEYFKKKGKSEEKVIYRKAPEASLENRNFDNLDDVPDGWNDGLLSRMFSLAISNAEDTKYAIEAEEVPSEDPLPEKRNPYFLPRKVSASDYVHGEWTEVVASERDSQKWEEEPLDLFELRKELNKISCDENNNKQSSNNEISRKRNNRRRRSKPIDSFEIGHWVGFE